MERADLRFHNGTFTVMVIGDLHETVEGQDEQDLRKTRDAMALLDAAAEAVKPDLAVYMGDMGKSGDEALMRKLIRRITLPLKKRNIPYALVFGNHDRECDLPLQRQLELYREEYPNLYIDDTPGLPGCGNCCVPVYGENGSRPVWRLWFADSHGSYEDQSVSYYDWLRPEQVRWYRETAAENAARDGKVLPALWFMHVPVREEYELLRKAKWYELPFSVHGFGKRKGGFYIQKDRSIGYLGEDPAAAEINSGIFDAWKETGDVRAAVFGHDHMNEFAGEVDGILLCQCKLTGFHPYTDGCNAGVRVFTLYENEPGRFDTKMVHFKELGLKSESLGFVQRHFHDRQVIWARIAAGAAGLAALGAGAAVLIKKTK